MVFFVVSSLLAVYGSGALFYREVGATCYACFRNKKVK